MDIYTDLLPFTKYTLRIEDCCVSFSYTGVFICYTYANDDPTDDIEAIVFENLVLDTVLANAVVDVDEALYWHEMTLDETRNLKGKSWAEIAAINPSPPWCGMYGSLSEGHLGCWSLISHKVTSKDDGPCSYCEYNRG